MFSIFKYQNSTALFLFCTINVINFIYAAPPALAVAAPPAVAAAPIAQAAPITANAQVQAADKNGESANGEAAKVGDELTKKIEGIEKELDTAIEDQNKQTVAGGVR